MCQATKFLYDLVHAFIAFSLRYDPSHDYSWKKKKVVLCEKGSRLELTSPSLDYPVVHSQRKKETRPYNLAGSATLLSRMLWCRGCRERDVGEEGDKEEG